MPRKNNGVEHPHARSGITEHPVQAGIKARELEEGQRSIELVQRAEAQREARNRDRAARRAEAKARATQEAVAADQSALPEGASGGNEPAE